MGPKKNMKRGKKVLDDRNRIERQRLMEIDDAIQRAMVMLPVSPVHQRCSRVEILRRLYEEGKKMVKEDKDAAAAAAAATAAVPTPSCSDGKKKEDEHDRKDDQDPPTRAQDV